VPVVGNFAGPSTIRDWQYFAATARRCRPSTSRPSSLLKRAGTFEAYCQRRDVADA
jgi:hypothetical protein